MNKRIAAYEPGTVELYNEWAPKGYKVTEAEKKKLMDRMGYIPERPVPRILRVQGPAISRSVKRAWSGTAQDAKDLGMINAAARIYRDKLEDMANRSLSKAKRTAFFQGGFDDGFKTIKQIVSGDYNTDAYG